MVIHNIDIIQNILFNGKIILSSISAVTIAVNPRCVIRTNVLRISNGMGEVRWNVEVNFHVFSQGIYMHSSLLFQLTNLVMDIVYDFIKNIWLNESVWVHCHVFPLFIQRRTTFWFPIFFPGQHSISDKEFTLKGKSLFLEVQILEIFQVEPYWEGKQFKFWQNCFPERYPFTLMYNL